MPSSSVPASGRLGNQTSLGHTLTPTPASHVAKDKGSQVVGAPFLQVTNRSTRFIRRKSTERPIQCEIQRNNKGVFSISMSHIFQPYK